MAFLDTLKRSNQVLGQPAGGTYGNEMYYGQPPINPGFTGGYGGGGQLQVDPYGLEENRRANRANADFAYRTRVGGDEAIRQENMRKIFDPNQLNFGHGMNVIQQPSIQEQGQITPIDRAKFDLAEKQIKEEGGLDRAQFGLKTKEYELDKLKNEQIYGVKNADMARKAEEAERNLKLAYDRLQQNQGNATATAAYHQAQMDATNAKMELQKQQHDNELSETKRLHDAQISKMQGDLDAARKSGSSEDVWTDDKGIQHKTTTSRKGTVPVKKSSREGYVRVISPDGRHGDWPANKPLPQGFVHIGE